ncbi:MAG TPA: sn-glycerol-3-phosphate ABC transporter ATP-binding protein UgpC [Gaiellaceae bacterium]|jgi:multiple sugar transport system ATP-binding protein
MAEIELQTVVKTFPNGVRAVDGVDLTIEDGEFMVLVGPSGCGKTTLLRCIAGLEEVTDGAILIAGRDVTDVDPKHRDIAMVFQNYALYPHMSVHRNIAFGLKVRRTPRNEIAARISDTARLLGLEDLMDRRPLALSGGQRQRVAMGRAIARRPLVYLMDEPLSNLDAKLRVRVRADLARLHAQLGVTTVYVTHDQVEAMTLGQRAAVMNAGKIQQVDTPQGLYWSPVNLFVAAFIGSPSMNLVEADVADGALRFAGFSLPLAALGADAAKLPERVILGVRPEHFAEVEDGRSPAWSIEGDVTVEENLGVEVLVFFPVDAPPVETDEIVSIREAEEDALLVQEARALFTARLPSGRRQLIGKKIRLALDPERCYFFDPVTGESLLARSAADELVPATV